MENLLVALVTGFCELCDVLTHDNELLSDKDVFTVEELRKAVIDAFGESKIYTIPRVTDERYAKREVEARFDRLEMSEEERNNLTLNMRKAVYDMSITTDEFMSWIKSGCPDFSDWKHNGDLGRLRLNQSHGKEPEIINPPDIAPDNPSQDIK